MEDFGAFPIFKEGCNMKKKLAILLSVAMVLTFALAACGGGNEDLSDSKYLGSWTADSMSFAGEEGDLDGNVWILALNDDGTGTFTGIEADGTEDVSDFTWSQTNGGFKTKGDVNLDFKEDGDDIVTKFMGVELRFKIEGEGSSDEFTFGDGAAYGYGGDDPIEAACYKYMAETVSKDYDAAEFSIPTVNIIHEDLTQEDEYLVYGNFWIDNYNGEGDTLKSVSGGNYPGCMHVSKDDYTVTAFDVVADGGNFEESAKEIFGDSYDDFMAVYSDSDKHAEDRKITVSDFVNLNGLEYKYYQDEGWDPVKLYEAGK